MELTGTAVQAADIVAVSQRIKIVAAEDHSARFPCEMLSRSSVLLKDGQRFESPITVAKGGLGTAMSSAEFSAKFHLLAGVSLGETQRMAIEWPVSEPPGNTSCKTLFGMCSLAKRWVPAMFLNKASVR